MTVWVTRLALLATALALVPSAAHLLELPGKLALDRDAYLATQAIYRGWSLLGGVLIAGLLLNLLQAWLRRREPAAAVWALAAALLTGMTLGVFFLWTWPANQATANWTRLPDDWETLRRAWEWSHAANAGLAFLALVAATLAAVRR